MRIRGVVLMGVLWGLTVVGFQLLVSARYAPERPDRALTWTAGETLQHSHDDQPYLLAPFMRQFVAWDSEYYLSIAVHGYDDPAVRFVEVGPRLVPLDYSFMPLYPAVIRVVSLPFWTVLGRVAAATLAGVVVSILGAIAGAVSLFALVRADGSEARAWKTAFFFLAFPASFFMAQVYTEGLFAGLALGCIALARYRQIGWAAFLAVLATWTRPVGVCLALPLAWACWEEYRSRPGNRAAAAAFLFALAPVAAFLVWRFSILGTGFAGVEREFFDRGPLALAASVRSWGWVWMQLLHGAPETRAYYLIDVAAALGALVACLVTLRRMPGVSLFGLAALAIPLTSGLFQGSIRFVMAVPSVFLALGAMAERSEVLDRAWTVVSLLLFGMLASLYTFDLWVA